MTDIETDVETGIEDIQLEPGEFYLSNDRLPRMDVNFEWTPEMVAEIKKCKRSIRYFAESFFYITTLDEGKKKIELYRPQTRVLKSLTDYRYNIICSSRQAGKTTLMTIYALWLTCFENDKRVVIVANKEKTAIMILRRIQLAYQQLPNWLKPGIKKWGGTEVYFANDSSIAISTTTGSAARGESINVLIIDEMAHIEEHLIEEFWASVIPTISSSRKTKIFAVSTPKGTGNKFYEIFTQAERGESEWHAEKIDWWEIPGRGKKWAREMLDALGGDKQLFAQEFENAFLETGESAIDTEVLRHFRAQCRDPEFTMDGEHYKIWFEPKPDHCYIVGVDVGEGIGRASSVAQVLDVTDLTNIEQVAIFHDNMLDPPHFAEKLRNIAHHWGKPPLLIERNNQGAEVINILKDTYLYEKIAVYEASDRKTGKMSFKIMRPGIYSHTNSKYTGVMNMRYWVNSLRVVNIYDLGTVHELETFVRYPNGTWGKRQGVNLYDDKVLALIWALFIFVEPVTEAFFEIAQFDDRGKPLKIKPYVVEQPQFFKLDGMFQTQGAPLPAFIGYNMSTQTDDKAALEMQGYRLL